MLLQDQVAIVTGGSRGIGKGIATVLAREGANVVIADINGEGARQTADALSLQGLSVAGMQADVTRSESIDQLTQDVMKRLIEKPGAISMVEAGGRQTTVPAVRHAPLRLTATEWQVLGREGQGDQAPPAVALRPFGHGRVVVMSLDGIDLLGSMPVVGGDARFEVSCASPASGKHCLKAIDGPTAPQSYYPDLETRVMPFGAPDYTGGTLQFDLKVDRGATVVVDVRSD